MGIRSLFGSLREKIVGKNLKIVFPEGNDERVLRAAARLKFEGLIEPIILGDAKEVRALLAKFGFADQDYVFINPAEYDKFDEMKEAFLEIRKGKVTCLSNLAWLTEWFLVPFIQLLIRFAQRFKSSKRNLGFHVLQGYS